MLEAGGFQLGLQAPGFEEVALVPGFGPGVDGPVEERGGRRVGSNIGDRDEPAGSQDAECFVEGALQFCVTQVMQACQACQLVDGVVREGHVPDRRDMGLEARGQRLTERHRRLDADDFRTRGGYGLGNEPAAGRGIDDDFGRFRVQSVQQLAQFFVSGIGEGGHGAVVQVAAPVESLCVGGHVQFRLSCRPVASCAHVGTTRRLVALSVCDWKPTTRQCCLGQERGRGTGLSLRTLLTFAGCRSLGGLWGCA